MGDLKGTLETLRRFDLRISLLVTVGRRAVRCATWGHQLRLVRSGQGDVKLYQVIPRSGQNTAIGRRAHEFGCLRKGRERAVLGGRERAGGDRVSVYRTGLRDG
jgi:hypothetical protein